MGQSTKLVYLNLFLLNTVYEVNTFLWCERALIPLLLLFTAMFFTHLCYFQGNVDFSDNPYADGKFKFYDQSLKNSITNEDQVSCEDDINLTMPAN